MVVFEITGPSLKEMYPIRANMWSWVKHPILELFVCCCVMVIRNLSDHRLLIQILVIGCCRKLSVGRIQTGHTNFIASQA